MYPAIPLISRGSLAISNDISFCPHTTEDFSLPVLLKWNFSSPEIWLLVWVTECYNHSVINNVISTLQNHHPNEVFLYFCSQNLWTTFSLTFLEWEISSHFKCATKMHRIYCINGRAMGQKEAPTPHEQLENTPRFSRKTKKTNNWAFLFSEEKVAANTQGRCNFSVSCVVQFLKALYCCFSG